VSSVSPDEINESKRKCLDEIGISDEINIHVPQSTQAIAEVEDLLKMSKHIISPQNNSPIASVIQDGAVGVYMLTNTWMSGERETMISKEIFQDCLEKTSISIERYQDVLQRAYMVYHNGYAEVKDKYKAEEDPEKRKKYKEDAKKFKEFCKYIIHNKKRDVYDCANEIPGKLMISILFPPVFCYHRTSNDNDIYPIVKIKHGIIEPTSGPLSKKECKYILHYLWKEHSTQHATMFLTEVQRLVYNWQPHHGFSMGLSDCMPTSRDEIAKALSEAQAKVADILSTQTCEIDDRTEAEINRVLNDAMNIGARLAKTSMNKGDRNALNIMRMSGAKGSLVNLIQIIAFVGQQNIDGKRMPRTLSNGTRSLPHFLPHDNSAEARGFISNSYIDGLTPEQAFNHAASGRQGVISTAIKSVTGDTPIVIIENNESKRVLIGEWIDNLIENSTDVEHYPKDNNLQLLKVRDTYIPTLDDEGKTSWGEMTAVTRHDPSDVLYKIVTESGREVTVAKSKSLLIWDDVEKKFLKKDSPDVVVGDCVPVSYSLPEPPVIDNVLDMSQYFPPTEYIYGTSMITAYSMMKEFDFKPPRFWWEKHNGTDFNLPYKYFWQLMRNFKRTDQLNLGTIEDYQEGSIYPLTTRRNNTIFPEQLPLDFDTGFFIGLYIADGDSNIKDGHIRVSKNDETIQKKVFQWMDKYRIRHEIHTKTNHVGSSTSIQGFSVPWAKFFLLFCGDGARNKHVPSFSFTAPDDFVKGLLNGYFSGDGCVSKEGKFINAMSTSKRLIDEIAFLLFRYKIFTSVRKTQHKENNLGTKDISPIYTLYIGQNWVRKFARNIGSEHPKKSKRLELAVHPGNKQKYKKNKNCIKDKIIKITLLNPDESSLYDVSVPLTSHFIVGNGVGQQNTADSGYIQKRIARKVEDLKVMMDSSVRDAAGNIIQFLYGDDGMDAKKLYACKDLKFPFFINVYSIADKTNSTAIRSEEVTDDDQPRHLRSEEIELLLTYIKIGPPGVNTSVISRATENFRSVFRKLLPKVKIYECKIGDYFAEIKHMLISSKVEYGDMVGLVAASSIGEPTTQLSTSGSTRVIVREVEKHGISVSEVKCGTIKEIIDKLLLTHDKEVINLGNDSVVWKPTHSIYIMTVNTDNEKTEWKKLSEVSRHPTNGNLVRVKTKSKREVTTTLTHSHLSRTKEGKIVPKVANDLKKGDFIPVNKRMNSKVFYNKAIIHGNGGIETVFPLDFKNGWVFGAYLAEGNITGETQLFITNISEHFGKRIKKFAKRYEGKYSFKDKRGQILPNYPKYEGRTHKVNGISHIIRFILNHCGTGSSKKNVPGFAYFAPLEFVAGLLRGYFDGDGNVNSERQLIRVHSISLNLLEQISLLLSRFGIFGSFGVEKKDQKNPLHYYILLRKHARLFLDNIGSDFPEKLSAIQEIVNYNEREDVHSRREDIDRIPEMGEEIARVAKPLGLPGYSRNYGRWTREKTSIGRGTLANYEKIFNDRAEELGRDIDLSHIHQAVNSDVIWDEIVEIEIIDDPKELVYDFGVEGNHTFMVQNGIFVHNTLNFFHLAGVGGKDVSLGVPRLNELLNITKSDKQKKPSCTIYLNDPILKAKSQKVCKLEEENNSLEEESDHYVKNEKKIKKTKEDALLIVQNMKKTFEETTVETFLKEHRLMYIPDDVHGGKGMNPIKIVTYEEYEEKWWVSLAKDLGNVPAIVPESWVVLLVLDTEKLFAAKVTLEEIALAIEDEADNQVACVPSPDVIGQIEVYFNFGCIKKYVKDKKSLPTDKEGLNEDNIDFFVCRDAIMSYIKKTHISGISRISKVYAREDPDSHEWILDTAGSNFLQILNTPGVDTNRTMSDDVWAVNEVLGIMAARKFLIEELTRVISFDGTYVNPRHIQLLVDRMTYTGDITSVRRDGISRESVGPIAKIMFEQQIGNGSMAALSTEVDLLKSVSSSVMYGTSAAIGTAAVDVQDPNKIPVKPPGIPSNHVRTKYAGASKRSKIM
jgi:DNA-directed RNA polymerase beta' subunit